MPKKMTLSFKDKEMYIYKYLQTKVNAGYYIKTLIVEDMGKDKNIKGEGKND